MKESIDEELTQVASLLKATGFVNAARVIARGTAEIRRLKAEIKRLSSGIIIRGKNMDEVTTNYARALVKSKLERLEQGEN